jgi:hypothetical protein
MSAIKDSQQQSSLAAMELSELLSGAAFCCAHIHSTEVIRAWST